MALNLAQFDHRLNILSLAAVIKIVLICADDSKNERLEQFYDLCYIALVQIAHFHVFGNGF